MQLFNPGKRAKSNDFHQTSFLTFEIPKDRCLWNKF